MKVNKIKVEEWVKMSEKEKLSLLANLTVQPVKEK